MVAAFRRHWTEHRWRWQGRPQGGFSLNAKTRAPWVPGSLSRPAGTAGAGPKHDAKRVALSEGERYGAVTMTSVDPLKIGDFTFASRLFLGTGKYGSVAETEAALEASGAQVVTVALRRVNLSDRGDGSMMQLVTSGRWTVLPNTAGCYTADDAIRTLHLARELGIADVVKLEVIGDKDTLYPDNEQTLLAAAQLVKDGFTVLPYCMDDPIICRKLEDVGCAAVMPLAAPIGSGLGIRNPHNLSIILERANVPVIVDAGVGTASDASVAMELGCDGVLMNTAVALAKQPVEMARAMRLAVEAGRIAFRAGRMPRRRYGSASSPDLGLI